MTIPPGPPELSYVLAAADTAEVHVALRWLRGHPVSPRIEVVVAAPAAALAFVAAALIPANVSLASAINPVNRTEVRVAGARATTGAVVVVVDCNEDLDARIADPFAGPEPAIETTWTADLEDSAVALPPVSAPVIGTIAAA